MIIDAQAHLWKPKAPDRPWPSDGAARAHLPYALTYEMMREIMDEAGVDRVVIVPPSWEGDRNDFALEAAQKYPDRFAVMGRIPLERPEAKKLIATWLDQPGMLGVRLTFAGEQLNWLTDGTIDWFWPMAAEAGIPIMAHTPMHMADVARIIRNHPRLVWIIDHMGMSMQISRDNRRAEAVTRTCSLARFPNVHVKLSSAPSYSHEMYPFADMARYIYKIVEAFSARRCFWGTDLTQAFTKCTYRERVTHFTERLDFLSTSDKEWIMGRAISECLRWP